MVWLELFSVTVLNCFVFFWDWSSHECKFRTNNQTGNWGEPPLWLPLLTVISPRRNIIIKHCCFCCCFVNLYVYTFDSHISQTHKYVLWDMFVSIIIFNSAYRRTNRGLFCTRVHKFRAWTFNVTLFANSWLNLTTKWSPDIWVCFCILTIHTSFVILVEIVTVWS